MSCTLMLSKTRSLENFSRPSGTTPIEWIKRRQKNQILILSSYQWWKKIPYKPANKIYHLSQFTVGKVWHSAYKWSLTSIMLFLSFLAMFLSFSSYKAEWVLTYPPWMNGFKNCANSDLFAECIFTSIWFSTAVVMDLIVSCVGGWGWIGKQSKDSRK